MRDLKRLIRIIRWLGLASMCATAMACSLIFNADDYVGGTDAGGYDDSDSGVGAAGAGSGGSAGTGGTDAGTGGMDAGAPTGGTDAGTGGSGTGGMDGGAGTAGSDAGPDGAAGTDAASCGDAAACEADGGWWICHEGSCLDCDQDNDSYVRDHPGCDDEVMPDEPRDCDDENDEVHPNAPALCGDGVLNSCNLQVPEELRQRFGIEELGVLWPSELPSDWVSIEVSNATQISVAGNNGESTDQTAVLLSFMEVVGEGGEQASRARLWAGDFWDDGAFDDGNVRDVDLSGEAQAPGIVSVRVRRLKWADRTLVASIENRDSSGSVSETSGNRIWYLEVAGADHIWSDPDNGTVQLPSPPVSYPVPTACNPAQQMRPRLAISAGSADGDLARTTWLQVGGVAAGRADVVSHVFGPDRFQCPIADSRQLTAGDFAHISGSSGPFVLGSVSGDSFVWEGWPNPPADIPEVVTQDSRPAWAHFATDTYLAAVGRGNAYQTFNLSCAVRNAGFSSGDSPCRVEASTTATLPARAELAAMDDIDDATGVLAMVESFSSGGYTTENVVVRLFDQDGRPLTPGGYQEQPPDQPDIAWRLPLVRHEYARAYQDEDNDRRILDLAVSAWADQNGLSDYGLTIIVAGIATVNTRPVDDPPGGVEAGDFVFLSGLRGCRER